MGFSLSITSGLAACLAQVPRGVKQRFQPLRGSRRSPTQHVGVLLSWWRCAELDVSGTGIPGLCPTPQSRCSPWDPEEQEEDFSRRDVPVLLSSAALSCSLHRAQLLICLPQVFLQDSLKVPSSTRVFHC